MNRTPGRRWLLAFLALGALVALAGCGLGPTAETTDEPSYPAVLENTTAALSEENASALLATLTDEEGRLTPTGERWVDRLERVAAVGPTQRDAVARSTAVDGVSEQRLRLLDAVLDSPPVVQRTVLERGLRDRTGDGLLDGEAVLFDLAPTASHPTVARVAGPLRRDGYDNRSLSYLDRLANRTSDPFQRAQIRGFGLANRPANGTVTAADSRALEDGSGDGLLNGTATRLGLDAADSHSLVAALAKPLAEDGYTTVERSYLGRTANISTNRSARAQAAALGLLGDTARTGVNRTAVGALDRRESGLLAGFARRLGLDSRTGNATVARLTSRLSAGGLASTDVAFLDRAATVTADSFALAQARSLSLLDGPVANGSATTADRAALADSAGDGLLDPMARRLGANSSVGHPRLADLARPLAAGGYTETGLAYLDRLQTLGQYRGNEYERWAQARQLGLLDAAVANGTVTDRQLWELRNNASNRLLNGMEVAFGTDPELADTSGDGYPDHLVWGPMRDLGLAVSPTEPDIYVELDAVAGQSLPGDDQLRTIVQTFRTEPETPINVHFYRCDTDHDGVSGIEEMTERASSYRTLRGLGFQYLLLVEDSIELDGDDAAGVAYVSPSNPSWMLVDGTLDERIGSAYETSAVAHELGHSLGISGEGFEGVDSRAYSEDRYTSVMNYNRWTPVTFSTGDPFDDYERMAERSYGSYHQPRDELAAMWSRGSVDRSLQCSVAST